jgi:hypothetical protein
VNTPTGGDHKDPQEQLMIGDLLGPGMTLDHTPSRMQPWYTLLEPVGPLAGKHKRPSYSSPLDRHNTSADLESGYMA